jgi:hypothetical protein
MTVSLFVRRYRQGFKWVCVVAVETLPKPLMAYDLVQTYQYTERRIASWHTDPAS